jgi:hypothetical protein
LSKTITQGQSTTFNINVSPVNNYSGTVNLSQTGCPSGASCTFSATADCTGGATASCTFTNNNPNPGASVLTVTNTAGVAAGTYTLTVTGTDTAPEPDLTDSDSSDLIVIAPAPVCAPPAFMSPTGSITRPADNKITLSWAAVPGADWYDVRLDYPPVDGIPKPNNIDPIPAPNCATPLSSNPHYVCENTVTAVYCSGGTCSIPNIPVPISNGPDYWFWLHPRVNTGAWGCTGATSFTLVAPNSPPSVTSVTVTEPDYCSSGPEARVNWACSDPEGDPWSAYQVQIDDTGSSWNSPYTVDTGKISGSGTSYFAGGGVPPWAWDTTYKARVRVWDSKDAVSNWKESSSWKTPKHAYPQVDFSYSPSTDIPAKQPVQFTDLTTFYDGGGGTRTWSWAFCPGSPTSCSPNSSASQNPTSTYNNAGLYTVIETVTDKDGYTCSCTQQGTCQTINIGLPIPCWKEVSPQ